jgi:hypothetical protein
LKFTKAFTNSLSLTACLIGSLMCTSTASATTILTGQVNFGGTVNVALGGITFFNGVGTAHLVDPSAPDTGGYSGFTAGTIKDLLGPATTGPVSIAQFLTLTVATGTVFFDLQNIAAGFGTNAACGSNTVGNVCTPLNSPFTLIQIAPNQVAISLSVSGVAYSGTAATGTDVTTGAFTTQNLIPGTITGILAQVGTAGGITNSYSATFSSVTPTGVPEPGTLAMIFTGLGMLGTGMLRRNRRS